MNPHKLTARIFLVLIVFFSSAEISFPKGPTAGRRGIVVDERLAALRRTPQLNAPLVRRLTRGRQLTVRSSKTTPDGVVFLRVNVTTRTHGWIQREAIASPSHAGDDWRLLDLIKASHGFDRIVRARIFLDHFPRSPLRPKALLLLGDAAQSQAADLSRDAAKRLNGSTTNAPGFTFYLNYSGLDRYNRQRVTFVFNRSTRSFHYDGAAWRELVRRYPKSAESVEARKHLAELAVVSQ